jgi:hypothetical protein
MCRPAEKNGLALSFAFPAGHRSRLLFLSGSWLKAASTRTTDGHDQFPQTSDNRFGGLSI